MAILQHWSPPAVNPQSASKCPLVFVSVDGAKMQQAHFLRFCFYLTTARMDGHSVEHVAPMAPDADGATLLCTKRKKWSAKDAFGTSDAFRVTNATNRSTRPTCAMLRTVKFTAAVAMADNMDQKALVLAWVPAACQWFKWFFFIEHTHAHTIPTTH